MKPNVIPLKPQVHFFQQLNSVGYVFTEDF